MSVLYHYFLSLMISKISLNFTNSAILIIHYKPSFSQNSNIIHRIVVQNLIAQSFLYMIKSNSYQLTALSHNRYSQSNLTYHQPLVTSLTTPDLHQLSCPLIQSQPELEDERLFFMASLQFMRKKKIQNYFLFHDQVIGQGSFAKVYKGMNILTNEIVAIKVMEMRHIAENKLYALLQAQIQIFKSLKHPNVLRCYDVLITDNNCYIVTEYCDDGQLSNYIKRKKSESNDSEIVKFTLEPLIYDIYQGLLYLERKNIIHRDIKMANILVKDGKAKIGDFGLASFSNQIFLDAKVGSPIYMAPEALLKGIYGPKTDVWAFGILLFQFFHDGKSLFEHCANTEQLEREIAIPFDESKIKAQISEDAKEMIEMCLTYDWQIRPSFKQLWSEGYIKSLRLKSYVQSKQLNCYKETALENFRKDIERSRSEIALQIGQRTDSNMDNQNNEKNDKPLDQQGQQLQEGYSFEDFVRINSQNGNDTILIQQTFKDPKSEQIINRGSQTLCPSAKQQQDSTKTDNQSLSLEDQMQQFYRQAEKMMNLEKQNMNESAKQNLPLEMSPQRMIKDFTKSESKIYCQKSLMVDEITQIKTQNQNQTQNLSQRVVQTTKVFHDTTLKGEGNVNVSKIDKDNMEQKSQRKGRKINLNKNYSKADDYQDKLISLGKQTSDECVNHSSFRLQIEIKNSLFEEKKFDQQVKKKNHLTKTNKDEQLLIEENVQDENNQSSSIKCIVQETVSPKNPESEKGQSKIFTNRSHVQNLKKFSELMQKKQPRQKAQMKQKQKKRQTKLNNQSWSIDLVLALLQYVRFVVKYCKFFEKQFQVFKEQNQMKTFSQKQDGLKFAEIQEFYESLFKSRDDNINLSHRLYNFCNEVLLKKVSEIVLILSSEKSYDLLEIVKTHKALINGLKIQNNKQSFDKEATNIMFEQIYQRNKKTQEILTLFTEMDSSQKTQKSLKITSRICLFGLWESRIYDVYIDLQKYLWITGQKYECKETSEIDDARWLMKKMEQFVDFYDNSQGYFKFQKNCEEYGTNQNLSEGVQHNQILQKQISKLNNDINYFFQLIYEIQLKRMNSDD